MRVAREEKIFLPEGRSPEGKQIFSSLATLIEVSFHLITPIFWISVKFHFLPPILLQSEHQNSLLLEVF